MPLEPGSFSPSMSHLQVVAFFNEAMIKAGLNKWAGPPVVQAVHQSLEGVRVARVCAYA